MTTGIPFGCAVGHSVLFAALLVGAPMAATNAFAGECPAGKMQANVRPPVSTPASGVTDTTLGSIDLGKEQVMLKDHELRFRKVTIAPGGVVPWHSHADRPALIFEDQRRTIGVAMPRYNAARRNRHLAEPQFVVLEHHLFLAEINRAQGRVGHTRCRRADRRPDIGLHFSGRAFASERVGG